MLPFLFGVNLSHNDDVGRYAELLQPSFIEQPECLFKNIFFFRINHLEHSLLVREKISAQTMSIDDLREAQKLVYIAQVGENAMMAEAIKALSGNLPTSISCSFGQNFCVCCTEVCNFPFRAAISEKIFIDNTVISE